MYATPWEDPRTLNFVLISVLIGLAAFCASYTWNVWRRRNAAANEGTLPISRWRALFSVMGGCGALAALGAIAIREVRPPSGQIVAERMFTVRARENYQVLSISSADRVVAGDVIARLYSPPVAAESAEFDARIAEEQAESAKAAVLAMQLDTELVRRHQNAISRQQQFTASRDQILPARESVALVKTQGDLERREKLAHLKDERQTVLGDMKVAVSRQALARNNLRRIERLKGKSAVTASELDEVHTQLTAITEEIRKLEARSTAIDEEIAEVERSRSELATECERQLARYAAELRRIDTGLAEATAEEAKLEKLLADDTARAEQAKRHELERLAAKVRQSEAKQIGARQTLEVRAPFGGRVVYRERSPNTAEPQDALLVIGDDDGLVLRTRMPIAQAESLASASVVEAELAVAVLVPYFSATYLRHAALEQRPGYAVVELACRLPEDSVRDVVHGRTVTARLLWRPPLWTIGPFNVGAALVGVGIVGWLATGHRSKRQMRAKRSSAANNGARTRNGAATRESTANAVAFLAPRELEVGELAVTLRMLGDRFRTAIIHDQLDDQLIAAVEWALDRHQARAIEILAQAVDDEILAESAAAWLDAHNGANSFADSVNGKLACPASRVSRILATIAPNLVDHAPLRR